MSASSHRRRPWLTAGPLVVVIAIAAFALSARDFGGGGLRDRLFDVFARVSGAPQTVGDSFLVVDIDETSLARLGPWPWPRARLARLVENAEAAGARGVVVAAPIAGPDPLSPDVLARTVLADAAPIDIVSAVGALRNSDAIYADALAGLPSAQTVAPELLRGDLSAAGQRPAAPARAAWLQTGARDERMALPPARAPRLLPDAIENAVEISVLGFPLDDDRVFRRAPLLFERAGAPVASAPLAAARLAAGEPVRVRLDASGMRGPGRAPVSVGLGNAEVALNADTTLRFQPPKDVSTPTMPAWRLLDGSARPAMVSGRVLIVGSSAAQAPIATPRGDLAPAAVVAIMADQILAGRSAARPAFAAPLETAIALLLGVAAVFISQRSGRVAVAIAGAGAAIAIAGSFGAYAAAGVLIDPWPAVAAVLAASLFVGVGRALGLAIEDDHMRGPFQGALPASALSALSSADGRKILAPVRRDVTILACDVSASAASDGALEDPGLVARRVAAAVEHVRLRLVDAGASVEQGGGGLVLGYFNAPADVDEHRIAACAAALDLVESIDDVNGDLEEAASVDGAAFAPVRLAIGLASGEAVATVLSAHGRRRYAVIGDPVERAARLRSRSRLYGPAVIADEAVYRETHHKYAFLEVDLLQLEEEDRQSHVYALLGNPFVKASPQYRAVAEAQRGLLAAYRSGDMEAAREMLARLDRQPGAPGALTALYARRIAAATRKVAGEETAAEPQPV